LLIAMGDFFFLAFSLTGRIIRKAAARVKKKEK